MSLPSEFVDLSDVSDSVPLSARSFISEVRLGYHVSNGSWKPWCSSVQQLVKHSPVFYFTLGLGVGSLMRSLPVLSSLPSSILNLKGYSTTGKTTLLQALVSLRANPSDMTWGFENVSTLKWFTVAAHHNFLAIDDLHMAIIPDDAVAVPAPLSYFQWLDQNAPPNCTLITTSVPSIDLLQKKRMPFTFEIDAGHYPIWPVADGMDPWWMDAHLSVLRSNFGQAYDKIQHSLVTNTDVWSDMASDLLKRYPKDLNPAQRGFFVLSKLGHQWLREHAFVEGDAGIHDVLLKSI